MFKVGKHRQVFVTQIASEGPVEGLVIRWRKRWRESREVVKPVVAPALIIGAELWKEKRCIRADDTRSAWICIGINEAWRARWDALERTKKRKIPSLIKWRSRRILC